MSECTDKLSDSGLGCVSGLSKVDDLALRTATSKIGSVSDGVWHHIAAVWSHRTQSASVYVDGRASGHSVRYRPTNENGVRVR